MGASGLRIEAAKGSRGREAEVVTRLGPGDDVECDGGVLDGAGEYAVGDAPWVTSPKSGPIETRPRLGLRPTSPQHAAGMRIEPPRSRAVGERDDPGRDGGGAATRGAARRERTVPGVARRPEPRVLGHRPQPELGRVRPPITIAPASRRRRTWALSWVGRQSPNAREPCVVGSPSTAETRSLSAIGTPHNGRGSPARISVRFGAGALVAARHERVQVAVELVAGEQGGVDELARRDRAGADERRLLDGAGSSGELMRRTT